MNVQRASMILLFLIATLAASTASASSPPFQNDDVTAIVGATVIDGNGGPPLNDATIVVRDGRITDIGPKSSIAVAPGAQVIDGTGK